MEDLRLESLAELILQKLEFIEGILIDRQKAFLSVEQSAKYLSISKHTLYQYSSKRVIPYYKLRGKKLFFLVEDLDRFILDRRNRFATNEEIAEEAATIILKGKR